MKQEIKDNSTPKELFTGGEWELRYSERNGYYFIDYEEGGENYTLTKLDCKGVDAALISQAKNMYYALKEITGFIDREGPASKNWQAITEWNEQAKAILQKANPNQ